MLWPRGGGHGEKREGKGTVLASSCLRPTEPSWGPMTVAALVSAVSRALFGATPDLGVRAACAMGVGGDALGRIGTTHRADAWSPAPRGQTRNSENRPTRPRRQRLRPAHARTVAPQAPPAVERRPKNRGDAFCWTLTKSWVLELAPANWRRTLEGADAQESLAANAFRPLTFGPPPGPPPPKVRPA
jgi:hypothetical protein